MLSLFRLLSQDMSRHSVIVSGYKYFEIQILDLPVADKVQVFNRKPAALSWL